MINIIQNTEYLFAIINAMSDMVRVVSKDGKVIMANSAFEKRFGSFLGIKCYEPFGQVGPCEHCLPREVLEDGESRRLTRKVRGRVYSVTVSPLCDSEQGNIAAVEVFRDITLDYNIKQNLLMQNAKMQKDLQLARKLQESLVKSAMPKVGGGYALAAGFFPCEAVGGDIYDCTVYGNKLVTYLADVSGHGVMPAMLAVFFSRVVRAACLTGNFKPSEILNYAQREFLQLKLADSIYITAFITVIDLKTNEALYSNAGLSVMPVLFRDGKFQELYMPSYPLCDWFTDTPYQDGSFDFREGTRMLIYSDGIDNIHSDPAVKERLFALLGKEDFQAEAFIEEVREKLHSKPEDDLTLLLCERSER
ncbi:MAG: SpoIIE family protein phosphatase [Christensenella sp.]|nr:SpoIIE family protein phosphatase [Christensenella sp.]